MTTETKDLLPCPFCGGAASFIGVGSRYGGIGVQCDVCPTELGIYWDKSGDADHAFSSSEEAAKAWNTRASATSAPEQTEADRKIMTLTNQLLELQLLIQRRPGMNMGLFDAYEKWNGECYLLDWMNAVDNATPHPPEAP